MSTEIGNAFRTEKISGLKSGLFEPKIGLKLVFGLYLNIDSYDELSITFHFNNIYSTVLLYRWVQFKLYLFHIDFFDTQILILIFSFNDLSIRLVDHSMEQMLLPGWGGDIRGSADYMGGFVLGAKYVDMGIFWSLYLSL